MNLAGVQRTEGAQKGSSQQSVVLSCLGVEHLEGEGQDDHPDHAGDRSLQGPEAAPLQPQDREGPNRRQEPGQEQGYAEEQV